MSFRYIKVKTKGRIEGEKLLVPKLRFKEFKDEWKTYNLKQILEIKNGLNKEKASFGTGTPIINYMDVNKNEILTANKIKGLVKLSEKEIENFRVHKGDIFFTRTSETSDEIGLSAALIEEINDCVFSGFILKATPIKNIFDNLFSGYYFRTYKLRKEIIKHSSITTRALTSGSLLYGMSINIPNINEQSKIGKTLYLLDQKIELQQKKIEALKIYKKGLLHNLKSNSQNWTEYKVKNLFDITRGQVIPKTNLKDSPTDNYIYPVYSSQTSNYGILGYDNTYDFDGKFLTWTTDGANAGKVFYRNGKFRCTNVCGLLHSNKNNDYINLLTADLLNYETPKYVSYVGNPKLMNNVIADIKIKLPSLEVQNKISHIFAIFDNKLFIEEQKLNNLNNAKKSLLQQMFI